MSKVYGNVRISTLDQNEDRQLDAMEKCEVPQKNVYMDKLSGKDFNRPQYQRMVKKLRSGDVDMTYLWIFLMIAAAAADRGG